MSIIKIPSGIISTVELQINLTWMSDDVLRELQSAVIAETANRGWANKPPEPPLPPLEYAEQKLVEYGAHIEAIKVYRARTGEGLKRAKDACDAHRATLPDYLNRAGRWANRT